MTTQTQHPTPTNPTDHPAHPHAYHAVLHDLITMGADLARAVHHQATAHTQAAEAALPPTPRPNPDTLIHLATSFERIARAIRRCIALSQHLGQPAKPANDPAQLRAAARKRILRVVEDTIQRPSNSHDHEGAGALNAELRERMEAPEFNDDLDTRPVADIIEEICRDLGLAARAGVSPFKRRTPADIAQLSAGASVPAPDCPKPPGASPTAWAPASSQWRPWPNARPEARPDD